MALGDTLYGVKSVIRDILFQELNRGKAQGSDEWVNVLYGWQNATSTNRMVVVGDGSVSYELDERTMSSKLSLRRYNLKYTVEIDCAASFMAYDEEHAERECYQLLDDVLTPLVRGDETGASLLIPYFSGIVDVEAISEQMVVKMEQVNNAPEPRYNVVRLELAINLRRD